MSKKTKPSKTTMTEVLRAAIQDSGLPMLRLAKETGVIRQSLIRFVKGETSLHLDIADKLADYFDLELIPRKGK